MAYRMKGAASTAVAVITAASIIAFPGGLARANPVAAGDHLRASQSQPICFEFFDVIDYIVALSKRREAATDLLGRCDEMLSDESYTITQLGNEPDGENIVANIILRRQSNLLFGWTVVGVAK